MHSFKGSTFENNYSLARDLVTIPLMACPQLFSLKHQNTTMVSKAHAKIKRLLGSVRKALCSMAKPK